MLFSSRVEVRSRFSVRSVSGYAHIILLSVVIVLYPAEYDCKHKWKFAACANSVLLIGVPEIGSHRKVLKTD